MFNPYYVPMFFHTPAPFHNDQRYSRSDVRQRRREVTLDIRRATRTDLGNGFYSFEWTNLVTINPQEFLLCFLEGQNINVLNGGFSPRDFATMYAMESFPRRRNQWVITVHNPVQSVRDLSLYLIAKT